MNTPPPRPGRFPFAPIIDGCFAPLPLAPSAFAVSLARDLSRLPWPDGVTVYLRGSRLEDPDPFPEADIDLITVVDDLAARQAAWESMRTWSEAQSLQVDTSAWSAREVEACAALRQLVVTRSHWLLGPPRAFSRVPADMATMRALAMRLGVWKIPAELSMHRVRRVCELKQLTRAFGVWHFLETGAFSRDVAICLTLAESLAPLAGRTLRQAWDQLDALELLDVQVVLASLTACETLWP